MPRSLPRGAGIALRWALSLGLLAVVAVVLWQRFGDVADTGVAWPHPLAVLAAVALFMVANEILVRAWLGLVAMGGGHLDPRRGRWVWATSQLARYAMGMAQVASRALVARRHGLSASAGAITTLLEVVWYACINGLLALATAPWWLPEASGLRWAAAFAVLPGLVVVLGLVAPRAFLHLAELASRLPLLRRIGGLADATDLDVAHHQTQWLTLAYIANALIRLTGFVLLYVGIGGEISDVMRVSGAFALGHLIGAVAVFAPGGLGPREGVTAVMLAGLIGPRPVLMLVGATRLLELVAELLFAGLARLSRPAEPVGPPPAPPPPPSRGDHTPATP